MGFDHFTIKAQQALQTAQNLASQTENPDVNVEHLLLALITQEDGVVTPIPQKVGTETQTIKSDVDEAIQKRSKGSGKQSRTAYLICTQGGF